MSKIVLYGDDPVLTTPTQKVETFDNDLKSLIENMKKTMVEEGGCGLAANQIGVDKSVLIIEDIGAIINPEIVEKQGKRKSEEGCLSFPSIAVYIKRAKKVLVKYIDETFQEREEWFDNFDAIVLQHEHDHLNGITFLEHLGSIRRDMVIKRMKLIREIRDQNGQI